MFNVVNASIYLLHLNKEVETPAHHIITLFSTIITVTAISESQLSAGFTICVQADVSHGG